MVDLNEGVEQNMALIISQGPIEGIKLSKKSKVVGHEALPLK
jgi:hypothetical protein